MDKPPVPYALEQIASCQSHQRRAGSARREAELGEKLHEAA
jgi:hypothetical protein